jgi:hypothetical protein
MSANIIENLTVCEIKEVISTPLFQTNTFSLTDSCTFYITSNPGTTVNLTNVSLTTNGVITVTFISPNGSMVMPTTLTVNGTAAGIKWQGGSAPSQSSGQIQLVVFSIITLNNAVAHVIGAKSNYS